MSEAARNEDQVRRDFPTVLLVEDDPGLQRQMVWAMADHFNVLAAGDRDSALEIFSQQPIGLVVLDLGLPPDPNGATEGLKTLETIVERRSGTKVVIASGNEDRAHAVRAVSLGAYDFFSKPVDFDDLRLTLLRARRVQELEEENLRLTTLVASPLDGIIGTSPQMAAVFETVRRIAPTDVSVMISGESGTGKELVARAVHRLSNRDGAPFIATNCAAIPENLLESELFGYERGAFTGAHKRTIGRIEAANGGTLFLDEIGDMPLSLQAKLLRFLQDRTIQRLGSPQSVSVDLRIVTATNRDLPAMMTAGTFREDLYFRINEIGVALPALRERTEDAVMIARALLRKYAELYRKPNARLSDQALVAITDYGWPGNVRELENRVKRAVVMATRDSLSASDLGLSEAAPTRGFETLKEVRARAESELMRKVLAAYQNNLSQAARVLGVSRPTLYHLIATHGIKVDIPEE